MLKNVASNWVQLFVTLVVTFILTPFVIDVLGADGYGVWLLIVSLTSYLLLLRGGIPIASLRSFTEQVARNDPAKLNEAVASSLLLYLSIGAVAVLIGGLLFIAFELGFDVPLVWSTQARFAFWLVIGNVALGFIVNLPYNVMEAHEDFPIRNGILITSVLTRLGLTIALLSVKASVLLLALVFFTCLVLELSLGLLVVKRRYPAVRIRLAGVDRTTVRKLLRLSVGVLILLMSIRLAYHTDAVVIGAFLTLDDVSIYSVANSLGMHLVAFIAAISEPILPRATKLKGAGKLDELKVVFLRWSKLAFSFALMAGLYLAFLGPEFLGWWINPTFQVSGGPVLQILIVSFIFLLPAWGVGIRLLMGVGNPTRAALLFLTAAVANLILSIILVGPMDMGIVGVALGTAIPNVLLAIVVLPLACAEAGTRFVQYLKYVAIRPLIGSLPVIGFLYVLKVHVGVSGIVGLAASGFAMVALFAVVWLTFVYRNDPYLDLKTKFFRILRRLRARRRGEKN